MKKLLSIILALTMCLSVMTFTAVAADTLDDFELPKPQVGYLHIHHSGVDTWDDEIDAYAFIDQSVLDLILESQEDNFYEKYGMTSDAYKTFDIYMQIDTSVDDRNSWAYEESWDKEYDSAYDSPTMTKALYDASKTVDWGMGALYHEPVMAHYGDAIVEVPVETAEDGKVLRFDLENHTVYVRYRYLMIYGEGGNNSYKTSEWSDVWSVGKGGTQADLVKPTALAAPVISDLKQDEDGSTGLDYIIDIPQSIYDAEMYYTIIEDEFEPINIETQLSINGGEWQSGYTANAAWLNGGWRSTNWETPIYGQKDNIKLKVRFVADDAVLTSEWSNVLELNAMAFDASSWAQSELQQAEALGLIPEILDGADLTADITRAEFAAVSVKVYEALSGTPALPAVANPFTDTADPEILKAYNIGAVNGTSATTYSPNDLLNREQAATMLTRVFKRVTLPGWTLATDASFKLDYTKPALFADDADISDWAKESVYFMAANNIINGVGNNKFAPKNITTEEQAQGYANATREQALIIAMRMVENLKK